VIRQLAKTFLQLRLNPPYLIIFQNDIKKIIIIDMEQKIPKISNSDIKRIIEKDFPQFEFSEIESILQMYKSKSEEGRNRIYASILKLSDGNLKLIKKFVEKANYNFRDVISFSEYPN
jgi:hypothetical protein